MDLSCKICFESYTTIDPRRPRSLPCGHTLCGECATKLFANGRIMCPTCQQLYSYSDFKEITINRELEDVIDRQASVSTESGPKLHHGKCEEHGNYKVHYCMTHDMFICSDCVVAYHLDADCRRVPIGKVLNDRKAELCTQIDSRISYSQETGNNSSVTEIKSKSKIENLQSEIKILEQHMITCQSSTSKCTDLMNECGNRQNQAQNLKTFSELNLETQSMNSSGHKMQDLAKEAQIAQIIANPDKILELSALACNASVSSLTTNYHKGYGRYFEGRVENYTEWPLKNPKYCTWWGYISSPPRDIKPCEAGLVAGHKAGGCVTGTSGILSWKIQELDLSIIVCWSVPYDHSRCNALAVGIYKGLYEGEPSEKNKYDYFNDLYYNYKDHPIAAESKKKTINFKWFPVGSNSREFGTSNYGIWVCAKMTPTSAGEFRVKIGTI